MALEEMVCVIIEVYVLKVIVNCCTLQSLYNYNYIYWTEYNIYDV